MDKFFDGDSSLVWYDNTIELANYGVVRRVTLVLREQEASDIS